MGKNKNVNDEKIIIQQNLVVTHKFSDDELMTMSEEIAQEIQEKQSIEDERKAAASRFKSQIDAKDAVINRLAKCLGTKEEERSEECDVHMNTPRKGLKTAYRNDGVEVWQRAMDPEDMQLKLDMEVSDMHLVAHSDYQDNHK